ncbi:MAG: gamma carbonic anhydrase family protein [Dehalococcoidia bacterium]|nr:gamma carbonic anhydrase family protein [Dehalococcoidia bacterium]
MSIYSFEGKKPNINPKAHIHESAQIIGDVVIGANCFVGAGAILRGDYGSIQIGDRVAVEEGCIIHAPPGETCTIDSDVILGHGAVVHCSEIASHVRLGIGAIVSIHSKVETWVVIGDGAVVAFNKTLSSGKVYVGNPAKPVRALNDDDRKMTHLAMQLYADLCDRYHAGLKRLS